MRLLAFGLGYTATRFVELHGKRFDAIAATRREPGEAVPAGVRLLAFDGRTASAALREAVAEATHVLVSIPPNAGGDPVLACLARELGTVPALAWIGYLSTVGVYGDFHGGWVDEETPIRPAQERNRRRAEIEQAWLHLGRQRRTSVQIFRLAGIYGPGRNAIENLREGTARRIVKPGQVFSRIHVDDIAGVLAAAIARPDAGPVFNVADDEPAPPQDVVAYAASLIGVDPPAGIAFEDADLTPMARSFYAENRRVSNRRLSEQLGYRLAYPTFREGLAACLQALPAP
jgi:nucleoside-diphosphate-sugar epimerase